MPKKTTEPEPEQQTEKKRPAELKDDQLDEVQGGKAPERRTPGSPDGFLIRETGEF